MVVADDLICIFPSLLPEQSTTETVTHGTTDEADEESKLAENRMAVASENKSGER